MPPPGSEPSPGQRPRAPPAQLRAVVEALRERYAPERIILFGSYAWGQPREDSDVDLLIVKSTEERPFDRCYRVRTLIRREKRGMPMDILVYTPAELEARAPLLDHRVFEFAWRLPLSMKIRDGQGKWILRELLARHVPRALLERPKMGFGGPIEDWLRGPLRPWAEELLSERRLREDGFLDPAAVRAKWEQHLTGRRNWQAPIWAVLMFQIWLDAHHEAVDAATNRAPGAARSRSLSYA